MSEFKKLQEGSEILQGMQAKVAPIEGNRRQIQTEIREQLRQAEATTAVNSFRQAAIMEELPQDTAILSLEQLRRTAVATAASVGSFRQEAAVIMEQLRLTAAASGAEQLRQAWAATAASGEARSGNSAGRSYYRLHGNTLAQAIDRGRSWGC